MSLLQNLGFGELIIVIDLQLVPKAGLDSLHWRSIIKLKHFQSAGDIFPQGNQGHFLTDRTQLILRQNAEKRIST